MSDVRRPVDVFHPSEFILDEMRANNWTRGGLARRMGGNRDWALLALNTYLDEGPHDPSISIDGIAKGLEKAFQVSVTMWRNLEAEWRKWREENDHAK